MFISRIAMKGDQAAAGPQLTPGTSSSLWRDAGKTLKKCCSIFKPSNMLCNVVVFFFFFHTALFVCMFTCFALSLYNPTWHGSPRTHTHSHTQSSHVFSSCCVVVNKTDEHLQTERNWDRRVGDRLWLRCSSGRCFLSAGSWGIKFDLIFFFLAWILKYFQKCSSTNGSKKSLESTIISVPNCKWLQF